VGNDYPRLVALSHPLLRPSNDPLSIRRYSQQFVDLLDLRNNTFSTLPVHDVLNADYPPLRFIAQIDEDGYFETLRSALVPDPKKLVLTFDELLKRTPFAQRIKTILRSLETAYHSPVDVEFALQVNDRSPGKVNLDIAVLQCRPQSHLTETEVDPFPTNLEQKDILFSSDYMVPQGMISAVDYVVYVVPGQYFSISSNQERTHLARTIGRLNDLLKNENFICIGPGRWGSSNSDLGVPIAYGDIYHAKALVELAGENCGLPPEPSLGTHFFQDLLESQIYPLALQLDDPKTFFQQELLETAPNQLLDFAPDSKKFNGCLRLVKVNDLAPGKTLRILMHDEAGKALAYFCEK
jgi:hypothetical protein